MNDLKRMTSKAIEYKLNKLESIYFVTEDSEQRQKMILAIDELKLELYKRGQNDKSI